MVLVAGECELKGAQARGVHFGHGPHLRTLVLAFLPLKGQNLKRMKTGGCPAAEEYHI